MFFEGRIMKLFLDTADFAELNKWLATRWVDGITTNPTILKKAGLKDPMDAWKKIIELKGAHTIEPLSLSAEVFCDVPDEMVVQAKGFVKELNYPGTTIKIPILTSTGQNCLSVIQALAKERIAVNCTGCITWIQALAAAKAGARYVSLLYRRIMDAGLDGKEEIRETRELLDRYGLKAEIIAGSIRELRDITDCYEAGAHIVTVPPKFLDQLLFHQKSADTQKQFLEDAKI